MFAEQIKRFGDHVFEEGSMVIPGEHNYDLDYEYVKVNIPTFTTIQDLLQNQGLILRGESGIEANVKQFVAPEGTDPSTFYIEYLSSSTDYEQSRFSTNELIEIILNDNVIGECDALSTGKGSKFTINSGVYYLGGRFVAIEGQTILLDKYSVTPSKVVGIEFNEVAVTENEDSTLFDNAQGTPNFTAPGAHRLKVDTKLVSYDLDDIDSIPDNVAEIFRIENGQIQRKYTGSDYAQLGDTLAKRTFEESGNYTVRSFGISIEDNEIDSSKFNVGIESGLAYVEGYRIENHSTQTIEVDKARDTGIINNSSISAAIGNYILVSDLNIIPSTSTLQQITFYDVVVSTPGVVPGGSALGTANIRYVRKDGSNYRLYLFNIRNTAGTVDSSFIQSSLGIHSSIGEPFSCNIIEAELKDAVNNSLVFNLNVDGIKTLYDQFGNSDTSYQVVRQYNTTTDTSGIVSLSGSSNETFVAQDSTIAFASFMDTDELVEVSDKYSLAGSPLGSVISIDFGSGNAGRPVRINLQVAKEQVLQKTKTTQILTKTGLSEVSGKVQLEKADVFEIESIVDSNSNDVTDLFTLVQNKTKSYYGISYLTTNSTVSYPVSVTFKYFAHSAGDYFGPDSYVDVDFEDIPNEDGYKLSDVLDFRPRISDSGDNFTGVGSVVGNIPVPYSIIRTDVEHYLSRIDKVYVNKDGVFGVQKGVPSLNPREPETPANSMLLYRLEVPAYTGDIESIRAEKINNRRYTMKDIGTLENRIANLEYYVSLNLLEQETEAKQILDPTTGLNRFKNGFMTDSFVDHSVGDFAWSGYHVSVSDEGELRPEFSLNAVDLQIDSSSSTNVANNSGIVTLPFTQKTFLKQNLRSTTINVNPYAIYRWSGNVVLNPSVDRWIDTVYTNPDVTYHVFNNGRLTQTWNSWQLNWTGGSSSSSSTVRTFQAVQTTNTTVRTNIDIVNDRVIDTSVIPFMRTIDVAITGEGNRPESRMHFFFDGTNVNSYVRPTTGSFGQPVITDSDGGFNAIFRIPNNSAIKFRTGEKQLVVTDEPNNVTELSTSYGEATFTSFGQRNIRRQTIVATRNINTTTTTRRINTDPIAQSFFVERDGGVFITSINTFFSTKDSLTPIKIEIREMENGSPTQRIVPGGEKQLNPSQVNTSSDGSIATTFTFDYPVYLQDGAEYCFVLLSNSNNYNAHIATMGQKDKGTNRYIVEQPFIGVMFKSQNNSTWTEDQQSDIQFEIKCAEFNTNVVGELVLENTDFDPIILDINPIETINGSDELIIHRQHHNYVVGTQVVIDGATGGNGITSVNGQYLVTEVISPDEFKIQITEVATASGFIGGNTVSISNTVQATLLNPNIPEIILDKTNIIYEALGTSGQSIDGTETPYIPMTSYVSIVNGEINELNTPWLITNRQDETAKLSGNRSLKVKAYLASTNPNVSPVVDLQGATIITPFTMITKPNTIENDGSNNYANYRTRITGLTNPAMSLKVYIDALRPDGSDIVISCRTGNSEDELESSSWVQLDAINTQTTGSIDQYLENEYGLEDMNPFTLYQVMIQLKSNSATRYPICKRFRAIALGT
jgi:uncharacterized protein YfkK (UPF0435 family)